MDEIVQASRTQAESNHSQNLIPAWITDVSVKADGPVMAGQPTHPHNVLPSEIR